MFNPKFHRTYKGMGNAQHDETLQPEIPNSTSPPKPKTPNPKPLDPKTLDPKP